MRAFVTKKANESSAHLTPVKQENIPIRHRNELLGHHSDDVRLEGLKGRSWPECLAGGTGWRALSRHAGYRLLQYQKFAAEL